MNGYMRLITFLHAYMICAEKHKPPFIKNPTIPLIKTSKPAASTYST